MQAHSPIAIAQAWRDTHPKYVGGWVLLFEGVVTGWKQSLTRPATERIGALAVDDAGNVWQTTGHNDEDGATGWIKVAKEDITL